MVEGERGGLEGGRREGEGGERVARGSSGSEKGIRREKRVKKNEILLSLYHFFLSRSVLSCLFLFPLTILSSLFLYLNQ